MQYRISKEMFYHFKTVLDMFGGMATELYRRQKLAEELSEEQKKNREFQLRLRDEGIKAQMWDAFQAELQAGKSYVEAMKTITKAFKDYWWIKKKFRQEVIVWRASKVQQLTGQGKTGKEIGTLLGIKAGMVRKIMSNRKRRGV